VVPFLHGSHKFAKSKNEEEVPRKSMYKTEVYFNIKVQSIAPRVQSLKRYRELTAAALRGKSLEKRKSRQEFLCESVSNWLAKEWAPTEAPQHSTAVPSTLISIQKYLAQPANTTASPAAVFLKESRENMACNTQLVWLGIGFLGVTDKNRKSTILAVRDLGRHPFCGL